MQGYYNTGHCIGRRAPYTLVQYRAAPCTGHYSIGLRPILLLNTGRKAPCVRAQGEIHQHNQIQGCNTGLRPVFSSVWSDLLFLDLLVCGAHKSKKLSYITTGLGDLLQNIVCERFANMMRDRF